MRYGRLIPFFGSAKAMVSSAEGMVAVAASKARFESASQAIVQHMLAGLQEVCVPKWQVKDFYNGLTHPTALIWEPKCGVGHASVYIGRGDGDDGFRDVRGYASLFPGIDIRSGESGAGPEHILPGRMLEAAFSSFHDDCLSEGAGKVEGEGKLFRLPEHVVPMPRLDADAMRAAWTAIRHKPDAHYRMVRKNCSTLAARVIRAGMEGGSFGAAAALVKHKAWWTPYDVLTLAKAVA